MVSRRVFIAVKIQSNDTGAIQKVQTEWARTLKLPEKSFVPIENFHLTLHFLGKIESDLVGPLIENLKVYTSLRCFSFSLTQALLFPSPFNPRVLVMAGPSGNSPLSYLHAQIEKDLKSLGIPTEKRPFLPHVTLFRFREIIPTFPRLPPVNLELQIDEYALYESITESNRTQYRVIKSWLLS